jgi:predicted TIM-barrel fold metal-dependent hydrolase
MDAAGIDFQILSLFDPGVQDDSDVARAVDLAKRANDDLAGTVRETPHRSVHSRRCRPRIPTLPPLSWSVRSPISASWAGLINGHAQGRYLDDVAYGGLFERAQALNASIYLHPTTPHPAVMEA